MSQNYKDKLDLIIKNEIFTKKIPDPAELISILQGVQALSKKYDLLKNETASNVEDYEFKVFYQNKPDSQDLCSKTKQTEDLKQKNKKSLDELMQKCKNLPVAELEELIHRQKKIIDGILDMYPEAEKLDDDIFELAKKKLEFLLKQVNFDVMKENLVKINAEIDRIEGIKQQVEEKIRNLEEIKTTLENKKTEMENFTSQHIGDDGVKVVFSEEIKSNSSFLSQIYITKYENKTYHYQPREEMKDSLNLVNTALSTVSEHLSQNVIPSLQRLNGIKTTQIENNNEIEKEITILGTLIESMEKPLELRKSKFENKLTSYVNDFRNNQNRIDQILNLAGYSNAGDMIKDAKNIKEEIEIK